MIRSGFELANAEIRRAAELRAARQRAADEQQAGEGITPQHDAAAAALAADEGGERQEAAPDLDKVFRDAFPGPGAFPAPSAMSPGRGPVHPDLLAGRAAPSPGYQLPAAFNVPRGTLNAVDFRRGPLADGQAAPSPSWTERP